MAQSINFERRNHADALVQHLLALYIQEQVPESEQDLRRMGRLSLRIAWIFRERPQLSTLMATYLGKLKRLWEQLPQDEQEAMALSVLFFEGAMDRDHYYSDNRRYLDLLKLLTDLRLRCERLDEALEFLTQIFKRTQAERRRYELIYRDPKSLNPEKRRARVELRRLDGFAGELKGLRVEVLERLLNRDEALIEEIIQSSSDIKEALNLLRAKGLSSAQLNLLKKRGRFRTLERKKRFGIF